MKSERRHELQSNSLAATLANTPELLRQHGAKVLLGIIIILLIVIFIHQRTRRTQEAMDIGWSNIASARMAMERINVLPRLVESPAQAAAARKQLIESASQALASIIASDDTHVAAQAYLLRGDLNWTIANLPESTESATQPSMKIETTPAQALAKAKEAYSHVVRAYPDETQTVISARFGLASVAENEHDFAAAEKIYNDIMRDPVMIPAYKTLAEIKLAALDVIKHPVYLVPSTQPAVEKASTKPTAQP